MAVKSHAIGKKSFINLETAFLHHRAWNLLNRYNSLIFASYRVIYQVFSVELEQITCFCRPFGKKIRYWCLKNQLVGIWSWIYFSPKPSIMPDIKLVVLNWIVNKIVLKAAENRLIGGWWAYDRSPKGSLGLRYRSLRSRCARLWMPRPHIAGDRALCASADRGDLRSPAGGRSRIWAQESLANHHFLNKTVCISGNFRESFSAPIEWSPTWVAGKS